MHPHVVTENGVSLTVKGKHATILSLNRQAQDCASHAVSQA
jgi:hypothetical protein